jgi:diguanylate cyclase
VGIDIGTLLIGIFLGLLPVLLGVLIGALFVRRREARESAGQLESARAQQVLKDLLHWASAFSVDMNEYRDHVAELTEQIDGDETAPQKPARAASNQLMSKMVRANESLQQRLVDAELTLAEQSEQLAAYLSEARTDALTELPNRRAFDEELARRFAEWRRKGEPLSVVLVDIDRFKRLNDTYGHLAGDAVLQNTAAALQRDKRDMDFLARYGGEEIAMIVPGADWKAAQLPAERMRRAVEQETFVFENQRLQVTVSGGIAEVRPGEDLTQLLKRADEALYAAKAGGRNRCYCHNGQTCVPIGGEARANPDGSATTAADRAPAKPRLAVPLTGATDEDGDFRQACDNLRARLFERMGDA